MAPAARGALENVRLPVRSVLARPELSVAQLMALKPGDVIPITLAPPSRCSSARSGGRGQHRRTGGARRAPDPECSQRNREMSDMTEAPFGEGGGLAGRNYRLLADIPLRLSVEVGSTSLRLAELMDLAEGSVVELDRQANELLDILVNGTLVAKGEVVTVGNKFGIRVIDVVAAEARLEGVERRG
jgi:flagellar motor switch protein FliN/FliY